MTMSSASNLGKSSSKMAVKPDLKQSLRFLERDRVASKERHYFHQPLAALEQKRRKAIDKRYSDIIATRHKINKIQSSLDMLAQRPIKSSQVDWKAVSYTKPIDPVERLRSEWPIPGFKYHYNGEEKQTIKRLEDVNKLAWTGGYGVENQTKDDDFWRGWRKKSEATPAGTKRTAQMDRSNYVNGIVQRVKATGTMEPERAPGGRRSAVSRYENQGQRAGRNWGASASFIRSYRKRVGQEGRRMASFMRDQNSALDDDFVQKLGQSRSEIMLAVWKGGTGSSDVVANYRKSPDQGGRPPIVSGIECQPNFNVPRSFRRSGTEENDDMYMELKRKQDTKERIRHFLEEVESNVHRCRKDGPYIERQHLLTGGKARFE